MGKFHKIKIKEIQQETPDCISLSLDIPEKLREAFRYTQGQHLTFRQKLSGEEIRRSYSLCSSPLEQDWKVAIKKVPKGRFSAFAHQELKVGQELEVMPPMGRFFTPLTPENKKMYLAFAAGSGITPVLSIIKTILIQEPKSQVCLIYGNKGRNSIIFKEEIEGLKNKYLDRLSVFHVLSREKGNNEMFFGRIDKQKTKLFLEKITPPETIDECFICGPEPMIKAVKESLQEAGVESNKIHFELFGTGVKTPQLKSQQRPQGKGDKTSQVSIKLDGAVMHMEMSYYGLSLLDAAIEKGADLPYSCKGGVCSTCRARLLEGEVEMDVNYALEEEEVAAGYILTCQSRPLTDKVKVDFDQ